MAGFVDRLIVATFFGFADVFFAGDADLLFFFLGIVDLLPLVLKPCFDGKTYVTKVA